MSMLALWSGLVAGALHAVSGPDHLAALGPMSVRDASGRSGARVGAAWGTGHGAGLAVLVLLVLGAKLALPLDALTFGGELLVGVLLVVMGVSAWRALGSTTAPTHHHAEHVHRSVFAVGILHGATGAGHVLGVLPGLGLSGADATLYLIAYGASAAISMSFAGRLLGELAERAQPHTRTLLRRACAGLAALVGLAWSLHTLGLLA